MGDMLRSLVLGGIAAATLSCGGEGLVTGSEGAGSGASSAGGSSAAQGGSGGDPGAGGTGATGGDGGSAGQGGQAVGGAGGNTGAGGTGGNGGAGGSASTGELGEPCTWGNGDCIAGLYCQAAGCAAGTCQPPLNVAAQQQTYDPVCGCDGVHYFNPSIAASRSMAVAHAGVCAANEEVACDKVAAPCGGNLSCSILVSDAASCAPLTAGVCWGAPITCGTGQPMARGCVAMGECANKCALIRSQNAWHEDVTCQ